VIGINTAIVTRGMVAAYAGIGFAIPSETVKELLPFLEEGKEVVRGYLGVSIQGLETLPPEAAETFGLKEGHAGVVVDDVMSGTPAAKAGIKADDVILSYAGEPAKTVQGLQSRVARTAPGTKVDLRVWRDKKEMTIPVVIEKQPKQFFAQGENWRKEGSPGGEEKAEEEETEINALGLTARPMTPALAKQYGWEGNTEVEKAMVVTKVEPLGEAGAGLGIQAGDVILSVQGKMMTSSRALQKALSKEALSEGVRIRVKSAETGRSRILFERMPE